MRSGSLAPFSVEPLQIELLDARTDGTGLALEMGGQLLLRRPLTPPARQLQILRLGPGLIGVRILLAAGVNRVGRFAGQLLVGPQITLQPFDVLIREVRQVADIHVIRQVVQFDRHGQRIALYAGNITVVGLLLGVRQTAQCLDDFRRKPLGSQLLQRPVAVLDHIVQHPDDLLFGGCARGHDPHRVADIVVPGLVALAAVRLGGNLDGNLDGSFQSTHIWSLKKDC